MGLKFKDFVSAVKQLEKEIDPESEVYFVDQYGDTYPAESVISYYENSKKVMAIE